MGNLIFTHLKTQKGPDELKWKSASVQAEQNLVLSLVSKLALELLWTEQGLWSFSTPRSWPCTSSSLWIIAEQNEYNIHMTLLAVPASETEHCVCSIVLQWRALQRFRFEPNLSPSVSSNRVIQGKVRLLGLAISDWHQSVKRFKVGHINVTDRGMPCLVLSATVNQFTCSPVLLIKMVDH